MVEKLDISNLGRNARAASQILSALSGEQRSQALRCMAHSLHAQRAVIFKANALDLELADRSGVSGPMLKRLEVSDKVFRYMTDRMLEAAALPDPLGRVLEGHRRPSGLTVEKISVPIGVIGVIYESRPNVTTDAAAVCLKSGNAVILRGGSEAHNTNLALADALIGAAVTSGLPEHAVQIIRSPDREAARSLLRLSQYVDLLIPRGGKSLIKEVAEQATIPSLKHYEGICHLYLAQDAPEDMAIAIAVNSKCEKVEVCNALEKLLVDAGCAQRLIPALAREFVNQGVELRGCPRACALAPSVKPATESDWTEEYLAPILALKVVDGIAAAVEHINLFGSGHTDGIVTLRLDFAEAFVRGVDSASVMVNASTRLSGGGEYGLGAVVGISTDRLHARGPVGPNELTTYKWVARGNGHLRT